MRAYKFSPSPFSSSLSYLPASSSQLGTLLPTAIQRNRVSPFFSNLNLLRLLGEREDEDICQKSEGCSLRDPSQSRGFGT